MSRDLFSNEAADIVAEASAWIAQLETGELSAADLDGFREWLRRSPRHAAEIKRLARVSMDLNVLTDLAEPLREAATQYQPIVKRGIRRSMFTPSRVTVFVVAVSIIFSVLFISRQTNVPPDEPLLVATAIGKYREVELSDGTMVKLNTASQIEITYDKQKRKVRLLSGEAFFDVVPNPTRPFLVYAGENYIRVVGTAFVVRLIEKDFEVTVIKGRVELIEAATITDAGERQAPPAGKPNQGDANPAFKAPVILAAGQNIAISPMREVSPLVTLSERDLQRELSWQEGLHDFSNMPLEEIVKELGRYSRLEIEIVDPALRDLKFGGIFRIGEIQPLFDALETAFGIDVEYMDSNKVRLSLAVQD